MNLYHLPEPIKVDTLLGRLKHTAQYYLSTLGQVPTRYEQLKSTLARRFSNKQTPQMYREILETLVQESNETL